MLFLLRKRRRKQQNHACLEAAVKETVELVKEVVNNDSTKDLIGFFQGEMDKSREHESKVLQLLTQSNLVSDTCQQPPFEVMHHFGSAQYADGGPMTADYNQQWYRTLGSNITNQPGLPECCRSFTPTYSVPSTSKESFSPRKECQKCKTATNLTE